MPRAAPQDTRLLTQALKTQARNLGFSLVGVTTAAAPVHLSQFMDWIDLGRHGEMAYLASDRSLQRRADPRQILPECKSILLLGAAYPPAKDLAHQTPPGTGRVASYAWDADYHDLLPERLSRLVDFLEEQAGSPVPNRWYTDTGPVLERDLAQRAGLGWIGKNTCLIHPRKGSYFLLAEVLLGIDLDPDPAFTTDHCGTCTRCLEACPTGCILPDRTIDARRCISYLTIELKGAIPLDLRPQIGDWVFGCDVCQQVCPWNIRFAQDSGKTIFTPREGQDQPDLVESLSLTPEAFNQRFKHTPFKRAKRRGYLRNVCVVLGNLGDPAAVPALNLSLRTDFEPLVRGHAAWALGRIGSQDALDALEKALTTETDESVTLEIHQALQQERS